MSIQQFWTPPGGKLPDGTTDGEVLTWNNTTKTWGAAAAGGGGGRQTTLIQTADLTDVAAFAFTGLDPVGRYRLEVVDTRCTFGVYPWPQFKFLNALGGDFTTSYLSESHGPSGFATASARNQGSSQWCYLNTDGAGSSFDTLPSLIMEFRGHNHNTASGADRGGGVSGIAHTWRGDSGTYYGRTVFGANLASNYTAGGVHDLGGVSIRCNTNGTTLWKSGTANLYQIIEAA